MNNCSDTSERKKGKQLDISAVDTSVDEISDDTAEKEKISKKIPKIFGIFSSENYSDSSDKTTGTVIDENPETDISDKIDPSIFENVLQKQNETISQGLSSDDIDANLINKAGSDDEFDAIADIIEKEDEAERLNGVTESAEKLASFAEKMVPLMAVVYILGSLTIIFSNYDMILPAFKEIIVGAFDPSAATGGIIGASLKEAIRYGVARGLFSNEAGMGSTPHAHALAQVKHPCEQGLVAYVGLFFDTFIVLNMTALVILTTGVLDGKSTGIVLTQAAFTAGLGDIGPGFVAICLFFFAFTTIVGWYFFGEQNVKYLLGLRWVQSYRVLVLCFLMLGSFLHVTLVWELADFFNGIMVIPNVIALLALSGLVAKVLKDYDTKFMLGETPEYGALSPSGGEPFSLEPSPRKGRRFSRLKLRLRRKKTPPVNLDEMDQLKERGLDRF